MRRIATALFFLVPALIGAFLLVFGAWIFLVNAFPSPTTMVCGVIAVGLTWRAWRSHRRALAAVADD